MASTSAWAAAPATVPRISLHRRDRCSHQKISAVPGSGFPPVASPVTKTSIKAALDPPVPNATPPLTGRLPKSTSSISITPRPATHSPARIATLPVRNATLQASMASHAMREFSSQNALTATPIRTRQSSVRDAIPATPLPPGSDLHLPRPLITQKHTTR